VPLFDESQVRVILLDIEGTTTPIDFVYHTLFPYASRKLESFLREHSLDPEIDMLLQDLEAQHELDVQLGLQPPAWLHDSGEERLHSSVAYGQWLMARDSKCTPLKSLQGKIWQEGFDSGELHGEVYPDVPPAFERWRIQKKSICIYSSGSVVAQRLLFRTVASGDLTRYIAKFFDTRMGVKTESESYKKIAASVGREAREILFLSDAPKEIEAARSAGMQAFLCDRSGQTTTSAAQRSEERSTLRGFNEIFPD
jgi:enolase-phosphatase E1